MDATHNWHASWKRAEYYVADQLNMSIGTLRQEMTRSEFLDWLAYYRVQTELAKTKG